ncbi:MAG TPA: nucleotide exchange factor GrpE [Patescibacteria group bacterium]|nr:nucleotide exchange factor GrpE [Patescibacteria group bacterium]
MDKSAKKTSGHDEQQAVENENLKVDDKAQAAEQQKEEEKETIDYKDKYLRALADYQNLVKRVEKERQDFVHYANEQLISKLLVVLDDLTRAHETTKDHGIELIYKNFVHLLKDEGIEIIRIKPDDTFDPAHMECIDAEEGGTRLVELRPGYRLKGKLLRPTRVKVIK